MQRRSRHRVHWHAGSCCGGGFFRVRPPVGTPGFRRIRWDRKPSIQVHRGCGRPTCWLCRASLGRYVVDLPVQAPSRKWHARGRPAIGNTSDMQPVTRSAGERASTLSYDSGSNTYDSGAGEEVEVRGSDGEDEPLDYGDIMSSLPGNPGEERAPIGDDWPWDQFPVDDEEELIGGSLDPAVQALVDALIQENPSCIDLSIQAARASLAYEWVSSRMDTLIERDIQVWAALSLMEELEGLETGRTSFGLASGLFRGSGLTWREYIEREGSMTNIRPGWHKVIGAMAAKLAEEYALAQLTVQALFVYCCQYRPECSCCHELGRGDEALW